MLVELKKPTSSADNELQSGSPSPEWRGIFGSSVSNAKGSPSPRDVMKEMSAFNGSSGSQSLFLFDTNANIDTSMILIEFPCGWSPMS
jgi:hypothetical protein